MRIGNNPHKDIVLENSKYTHQVVMPVYLPNQDGYFTDGLKILKHSIESLLKTTHQNTYITVVNNGSCNIVVDYLNDLFEKQKIQEIVHAPNIGKLNAILKGMAGNNIELVTVTDADVLFLNDWQRETTKIFKNLPKVGVVGIVPQFNMFKYHCGNVVYDNLLNKNLKFIPVKKPEGIASFYKSLGWDDTYNKDLLKYSLGLEHQDDKVYIGSGHFVATYKKQMFQEMTSYLNYKLGGGSESYLDTTTLKYDYWRVTTYDNYAYHMGNVFEDWMSQIDYTKVDNDTSISGFETQKPISPLLWYIKNKLFVKILLNNRVSKWFYRWKGLPKKMIENYNNLGAK